MILADKNRNEDNLFYHYTDANGLIGILSEGKLRSTHISYLNDGEESQYNIKSHLIPATFKYLENRAKEDINYKIFLENYKEYHRLNRDYKPRIDYFVISFSEEGDDLSMWRSYCNQGGYSLGFKKQELEKLRFEHGGRNSNCGIFDCEYLGLKDIDKFGDQIISSFFSQLSVEEHISKRDKNANHKLITQLNYNIYPQRSIQVKSPEFAHEKEWRFRNYASPEDERIKVRTKGQLIIPYTEIDLRDIISEVVINIEPGPYSDIQARHMSFVASVSKLTLKVNHTIHSYRLL